MHSLHLLLLVDQLLGFNQFCSNIALIRSNLQKDSHQDNISFACLLFYKHNCLNILAGNICFHMQVKNQFKCR